MPPISAQDRIAATVNDLATFPVLTQETSPGGGSTGGELIRSGAPASLGRVAHDTIRAVLGWRFRSEDVKGFRAALASTAVAKSIDGFVEYEWRSPTFMVQADLGEITGAQASLLTRAKSTVEQALPLLDRLAPLRADDDDEDIAAMRALIRSELEELVEELGQLGGPRVPRVDGIFLLLLGSAVGEFDGGKQIVTALPPEVTSHLEQLAERLGLEERRVNTVSEERGYTDYLIFQDLVLSLGETWFRHRRMFLGGVNRKAYLGNELVRLSRYLDVIIESVHECYMAMDSVFFGPAERQTYEMELPYGKDDKGATVVSVMTVAGLLDWVEAFAANEARQLIQDGGKDGVVTAYYVLLRQHSLVHAAYLHAKGESLEAAASAGNTPVRGEAAEGAAHHTCNGIHSVRVIRALCELDGYLAQAVAGQGISRHSLIPPVVAKEVVYANTVLSRLQIAGLTAATYRTPVLEKPALATTGPDLLWNAYVPEHPYYFARGGEIPGGGKTPKDPKKPADPKKPNK